MAYADLNPVRAGMALSLERSWHTGVARRLAKLRGEAQVTVAAPSVEQSEQSPPTREPRIKPIAGAMSRFGPDVSENQYLELVAWSALRHCEGKASLSEPAATLKQLGCSEGEWQQQLDAVKLRWRVIGGSEHVRKLGDRIGQQWFCRHRERRAIRRPKPPTESSASQAAPF